MSVDLSRFLDMQKSHYAEQYGMIFQNQYDSGWIEYIFPRMITECYSPRSQRYGLASEKEKNAFWRNKYLRRNYIEMLRLVNKKLDTPMHELFSDRAKMKIWQSVQIFYPIAEKSDRDVMLEYIKKAGKGNSCSNF